MPSQSSMLQAGRTCQSPPLQTSAEGVRHEEHLARKQTRSRARARARSQAKGSPPPQKISDQF
eukprot:15387973-Alexandrium_andersonii.AAC.1